MCLPSSKGPNGEILERELQVICKTQLTAFLLDHVLLFNRYRKEGPLQKCGPIDISLQTGASFPRQL